MMAQCQQFSGEIPQFFMLSSSVHQELNASRISSLLDNFLFSILQPDACTIVMVTDPDITRTGLKKRLQVATKACYHFQFGESPVSS